jgi:hypothetical protein
MRKSKSELSDSVGATRVLRGEPNSEPAILAWVLSAWAWRVVEPAAASRCTAGVEIEGQREHQAIHQTARVQLAPTLSIKPNPDFYTPLRYSVGSPWIVNHETPRAVGLVPQNIRVLCRELDGLTVWPGARE